MVDKYTIYVLNQSSDTQTFWCFLSEPKELVSDPGVYANSAASIAIKPNYKGLVSFGIPVQYVVGAGASNNAVGLNVEIISAISDGANLGDVWQAVYATVPPNMGPDLNGPAQGAPTNTIQIVSNDFDKSHNEANGWFSNQSFGILTEAGFMGMSWSPSPSIKRTITPKLSFYVAVGDFGSNSLASWNDVSVSSQVAMAPNDFSTNKATITYSSTGTWSIKPGAPSISDLLSVSNVTSYGAMLSDDALVTAALTYLSLNEDQLDEVSAVAWDPGSAARSLGEETKLSGTLTVKEALGASFAFFILAGVTFSIKGSSKGVAAFRFSYAGPLGASSVKALFKAGAKIFLGSKSSDE